MVERIAVCDDNSVDTDFVQRLLQEWASLRNITVNAVSFSSAESFLFHYAEDKSFDILLLDIEMSGMDGVSLAKQIRKENETVQIVFITGYGDYIAEGYEVAALHYLMKPLNREKLFSVLDRAIEKRVQNERFLILELGGEMVRIPQYEIRYLDVCKNYVTVHSKKDYTVKSSLGKFEALLDDRFFRVGRGLILNLRYVRRVTRTEVFLDGNTALPLPRGSYESLNQAIIART